MKLKTSTLEVIDDIGNRKDKEDEATEDGDGDGFRITQPFLEFAFDKEVSKFSVSPGTNPGDNYLSTIYAVEVIFKEEEVTEDEAYHHYLIKCYPSHPGTQAMADQLNSFGKELFMYRDFLPTLQQLAKDCTSLSLSTAPFHGGNVASSPSPKWRDSKWAKENFLIMSDLRQSGYVMKDRLQGLDLEHAKLVLTEMARWHALAWAHKERNGWPMLSKQYPLLLDNTYNNEGFTEGIRIFLDELMKNALVFTEEALRADHPAQDCFRKAVEVGTLEKLGKFMRPQGLNVEVFENMLRIKHPPEGEQESHRGPWLTLTHGDCWTNNLLFRYDPHNNPVQVTFIDLQAYREACPTLDLAYLLFTSVRAPIRIPHKDELLLTYHDYFLHSCTQLNVNPFPGFSMDSLQSRYRRAELFGLISSIPVLSVALKPVEEEAIINLDKDNSNDDDNDGDDDERGLEDGGKDMTGIQLFSKACQGTDKNSLFKDELIQTVLDLYENGVI